MRPMIALLILAASAVVARAQPLGTELNAPLARSVAWRSPQGDVLLRAQLFFPIQAPNYRAYFADVRRPRYVPVSAIGRVQIAERTPMFFVQGFEYGTEWELARLERRHGQDELHLPSRDPWNDSFFSDQAFSREDLRELIQSSGGDVYMLHPAGALEPGGYLLCGKPASDEGGWMRFCFDFEITGS